MLETVEQHKSAIRAMECPLAELRKAGAFEMSPFLRGLQQTEQMMAAFNARFELPGLEAIARMRAQFREIPISDVLARYAEQASALQKAMESMQTPWLDGANKIRSLSSFAEIQGIGGILTQLPTFDESVADTLRRGLGDWRDP